MQELKVKYGAVQIFDDVVPVDMYKELLIATRRVPWLFGWNTPSNPSSRYWHHEIGYGRKENMLDISANVKKHPLPIFSQYQDWLRSSLIPNDSKILRFYLNAQTYGTDGWPHTDTDRNDELTGVLYLNEGWKPEWGGETVVFDDSGDIQAAVIPRANRLLTFPSNKLHAPRPLSKAFEGLRVVLVVKIGAANGQNGSFFDQP